MPDAELKDLAIQLRGHARNEEFGIRRNLLRDAADAIERMLSQPGSSDDPGYKAVRQFLLEHKVNLMGWQWQRLEAPPTMSLDPTTGEWVEL